MYCNSIAIITNISQMPFYPTNFVDGCSYQGKLFVLRNWQLLGMYKVHMIGHLHLLFYTREIEEETCKSWFLNPQSLGAYYGFSCRNPEFGISRTWRIAQVNYRNLDDFRRKIARLSLVNWLANGNGFAHVCLVFVGRHFPNIPVSACHCDEALYRFVDATEGAFSGWYAPCTFWVCNYM